MKGTQLERTIEFFKETNIDVARIALQLVTEIVEERMEQPSRPAPAIPKVKRTRRTKKQIAEAAAKTSPVPTQRTIAEGAAAAGAPSEMAV